jgi:hypothetical protein
MRNKYFYLALLLFAALVGCKTQKQASQTKELSESLEVVEEVITPKIDTVKLISSYQSGIKTVTAQYQIYLTGNKNMSIKGMLSSEHNKSLTVSIQMLLGIEIARIHCTPDSIWALDKLSQKYYEADFATFSKELGTDFYGLQALLTNRTFDPERLNFDNFTVDLVEENYILALNKDMYTEFIVEAGKYLTRTLLKKNNSGSYLMTSYSSFLPVGEYVFPTKVDCIFQSKDKANTVTLNYSNISINNNSNLTFSIPANYRKADMSQLIKLVNGL